MGQQVLPTLSADMRLNTGGLTKDAAAIVAAVEKIESSGVAAAERVDAAMKRANDPTAAITGSKKTIAALEQTGNAGAQAMNKIASAVRDAARAGIDLSDIAKTTAAAYVQSGEVSTAAYRRIEQNGERLIAQYERQTAVIGKTAEELSRMKAEEAALAAERIGLIEQANRIRAAEQTLWDAEFAAARRARQQADAAAEEKAQAARQAVAVAAAEAQAVREAAFAYDQFEAAARRGIAAMREQDAVNAAAKKEQEAQALRDASFAYGQFEAAARRGMAAYREQQAAEAAAIAETERHAAAAGRLRAALDPAYAAQQRFDHEMTEARTLIAAGAISLDEYCAKLRMEQGELDQANNSHEEATKKSGALRYAYQDLGYQIQDVGASLSTVSGPSGLFRIFAQQGGQVFDALNRISMASGEASKEVKGTGEASGDAGTDIAGLGEQMTGVAEKVEHTGSKFSAVASFMAGPWGAAIMVGITVLGPLVGKLFETNDALDDAVSKLKDDAKATEATEKAKKLFAATLEGVTAAIREQQEALRQAAEGERTAAERANILARAEYGKADAIREATRARLMQAKVDAQAEYDLLRTRAATPGQRGENAALGLVAPEQTAGAIAAAQRVQRLEQELEALGKTASQAWKNYQASRVALANETAEKMATAEGRINAAYDEQARHARLAAYTNAAGGAVVDAALTRELEGIERNRQAALKAEQERQSAAKETANQIGRNITLAQARAIAEGIGGRVTSDHRSYAEQERLYAKYQAYKAGTGPWAALAAKPGTSNHELDQALDVAKSGGVTLKKLVDAYRSAGVKLVEALDEGDHYHVAWKKVGAQAQQQSAEITAAAREAIQAAAGKAQIANLYELADAYKATGGEALIAQARLKAESEAIKRHGDIEAAVSQETQVAIAKRVADGAQATAAMNEQAAVQEQVNEQVAAGLVPAAQAAQFMQDRLALLPLIAAQEAARQKADEAAARGDVARQKQFADAAATATAQLNDQAEAQRRGNAAKRDAQYVASMQGAADDLDRLRLEGQLIGANTAARVHDIAVLKAQQEASRYTFTPEQAADYVKAQVAIADQTQANASRQAQWNEELRVTAQIADDLGGSMSRAFGSVGEALGKAISILGHYGEEQQRIADDVAAGNLKAGDAAKLSANLQMNSLLGLTGAAKGLFKEHSAGYNAMMAAEKALTIVQLARTAVDVAGGAARMFASLGPFAFPVVAAMLGVMASLGFGGGGSSSGAASYAKGNTGTGTVLGDSTAQSASIKNALTELKNVDLLTNVYSREMAASLKSIDSKIQSAAALISRSDQSATFAASIPTGKSTSAGSVLSGVAVGALIAGPLGAIVGGLLNGLFGSSTKLIGSGLTALPKTLGAIVNTGYDLLSYADTEKKSKFFGITTGTSYGTQYGAGDPGVAAQFTAILKSFYTAIHAAAAPLGIATGDVEQKLNGFVIDLGKINLKEMSGDQIQKQLEAVFGAAADVISSQILPGLEKYEQVGEGYFQTMVRVASTVEAVTNALDELGASTASLGIDAKMGLAAQFDSISAMSSAVDAYFKAFYSAEEQAAAKTAQMGRVFDSLGLAMPSTLAGFRQLVEAQDLTTASGQSTYATLLQLAPAFADLQQAAEGAKSAADIASERADLQKQLWQALGDTASIRAAELAQLDPSNRALQQRLYDLADEAAATEAANKVAQERAGLETALLNLQGNTAALRERELAALDPANQALQRQIYALQDQQAATAAATQAEQEAAQAAAAVAQERSGIEQQLLQLQGDTVAIRERELAALDPTNRALQQQVYALTDLQAAAQAAAAVAQERAGLESQLLQLQGETAAQRARELAALDPSNRALQERIYALTDLQAAEQAAAQVEQERAGLQQQLWQLEGDTAAIRAAQLAGLDASNRALQEQVWALTDQQAATAAATQAAQEAAQAEQAIAQERAGLMSQLWQLTGDTAAIRAAQLASLDQSNRALQEQVWAVQDAQAAAKAAADLSSAWKSIGDTITDEVNRIRGLNDAGSAPAGYAALKGQFNAAIEAALAGDQIAAKSLPDLSKSLLDVAGRSATSSQELARIQAETAAMLERVTSRISVATAASDYATDGLTNAGSVAIDGASWWSRFAGGAEAPARIAANDGVTSADIEAVRDEMAVFRKEQADQMSDMLSVLAAIAGTNRKAADALARALGQGGGEGLAVVVQAAT